MSDQLLNALKSLLHGLLPDLRYAMVWEYTVISVTPGPPVKIEAIIADPTAPVMPNVENIVLWPGPSGCYALPALGSIVRLGFANGDATKPMMVGLDPNAAPTMVFLSGSGPFVARVGDTVTITPTDISTAVMVAGSNPVTITKPLQCTITSGSMVVQSP